MQHKPIRAVLGTLFLIAASGNLAFGWFRSFDWLHRNAPPIWDFLQLPVTQWTLIAVGLIFAATSLQASWRIADVGNEEPEDRFGQEKLASVSIGSERSVRQPTLNIGLHLIEKICVTDSANPRLGLSQLPYADPDGYGGIAISFDNLPPTVYARDVKALVSFLLENDKDAGHARWGVWINHAGPHTTFQPGDIRKLVPLIVVNHKELLLEDMREEDIHGEPLRPVTINPNWQKLKVVLIEERTAWGKWFLFHKATGYPDAHDGNDLLVLVESGILQ